MDLPEFNDWTLGLQQQLSSLFTKQNLEWKPASLILSFENSNISTNSTVIDCLRPLWSNNFQSVEEEESTVNFDRIGLCMEIVSIICEDFQNCPNLHLHHYYWRDLYSLFALWQGEDSSSIMGGIWIGASMMLSDEEINQHLAGNLLLPLLLNGATSELLQKETWDKHLQTCLSLLKARGGSSSIFGHRMERRPLNRKKATHAASTSTSSPSFTLDWFRSEFVPKLYPVSMQAAESRVPPSSYYCAPEESFLSTLSRVAEKDLQVK